MLLAVPSASISLQELSTLSTLASPGVDADKGRSDTRTSEGVRCAQGAGEGSHLGSSQLQLQGPALLALPTEPWCLPPGARESGAPN